MGDVEHSGNGSIGLAEAPLLAAGRLFGSRYRLERPIGRGGMAAVWLANDERLDRKVAIKVLSDTVADDAEFLGRFRREARLAAGLSHPNLVRVYDFDAGARPYLVMEYVNGGTLATRLRSGDAPPAERIAVELLDALRHIHAAAILHRDVKPQNVLIDNERHARLTDFGIASPRDATSLTKTGHVVGTESYMAPEVMRGEPASERSDLYSLGVVLADAAKGGAGAGLWSLIDQLREADPAARPVSASAALAELERSESRREPGGATETLPIVAAAPPKSVAFAAEEDEPTPRATPARSAAGDIPPASPSFDPQSSGSRRSRLWAAAALAVAVLGVGAALLFAGGDGGDGDGIPAKSAKASNEQSGDKEAANNGGGEEPAAEAPPTAEESAAAAPPTAEPVSDPGADGLALNQQGFDMTKSDPAGAVPILEQAVAALESSGDELNYNYALFNLAHALRLAGRPDEAIPLLEQRLEYPDQTEIVAAELEAARSEAGDDGGGTAAEDLGADG